MFGTSEPVPPLVGEPVAFVPELAVPGLSDLEVVADIWSGQSRQAREYALEVEAIAQLAHRRRRPDPMAARGGRGGPGIDTRSATPLALADVREDFVAELALIRGCSEHEARTAAVEALLLTARWHRPGRSCGPGGSPPATPAR